MQLGVDKDTIGEIAIKLAPFRDDIVVPSMAKT